MSSQHIVVPAGKTSDPIPLTPLMSLMAGPAVLGGAVLVEQLVLGTWVPWAAGSSGSCASLRPTTNATVRVTAATQNALVVVSDFGAWKVGDPVVNMSGVIASPSTTSEVALASFRIPPGFLPQAFRLDIVGEASFTNNANAKTLQVRMNGIGGSLAFQSPALASNLNYNFDSSIVGFDGQNIKGLGAGATGGWGLSTTAYVSLARDYMNNETEVVVSCTKATGTDTFQLDGLNVKLSF